MQPPGLRRTRHHDQLTVDEVDRPSSPIALVLEIKASRRAQAQRSDRRVAPQGGFVVAVPTHAFGAVRIEVQQAGVEDDAGRVLDALFQSRQCRCPQKRLLRRARIRVVPRIIAVPGDLAGHGDPLAVDHHLVVLPGDLLVQYRKGRAGFVVVKDAAMIEDFTVTGQQISRRIDGGCKEIEVAHSSRSTQPVVAHRCFATEQHALAFDAPAVARQAAISAHDPMTRHDDGDGVGPAGPGHGA